MCFIRLVTHHVTCFVCPYAPTWISCDQLPVLVPDGCPYRLIEHPRHFKMAASIFFSVLFKGRRGSERVDVVEQFISWGWQSVPVLF